MGGMNGAVGTTRAIQVAIVKPGDYRIVLPGTEDEAAELARANPEGKLFRVGGIPVWVEPERLYGDDSTVNN